MSNSQEGRDTTARLDKMAETVELLVDGQNRSETAIGAIQELLSRLVKSPSPIRADEQSTFTPEEKQGQRYSYIRSFNWTVFTVGITEREQCA